MRILFLGLTQPDHIEYDIHEWLAQQADPSEYQSIFVRQTPRSIFSRSEIIKEPGVVDHYWADFGRSMKVTPRPSHWRRGLMVARVMPSRLAFLVKKVHEFRPDFVYTSQQHLDCFYALALRRLTGVPHLLHLHYVPGPWLGKMTMYALHSTPYLITISEYVKKLVIDAGVKPEHVHIIYNGLLREVKGNYRDPAWLRRTFNLPDNAKVVISAGRLDREKKHEITIRAMAKVKPIVPEARLLICGRTFFSTSYEDSLKKLTSDLGLEDCVLFVGHRSDLPQIFASGDVFCLPSVTEAFGMVFIEAMSAGLPVAAVTSGAVPEVVRHGETGLLSAPDDADGLAANLMLFLQDPDMARKFGQAGQERVDQFFSGKRFKYDWDCTMQTFYHQASKQIAQ